MKKLVVVLTFVFIAASLIAGPEFYGNVRTGLWYQSFNKDYNNAQYGVDKSRLNLNHGLYTNSRFGANYQMKNFSGNVEVGFGSSCIYLRKAYGEYDLGNFSLLIGQNYTGFYPLASQVASKNSSSCGMCLFNYGATYDGRHPMIKISMNNGMYLIAMAPNKIDPYGTIKDTIDTIDALIPKLNIGMKLKVGNGFIHPTFGFNMSKYNIDFNQSEYDDNVTAYIFATTISQKMGILDILAQVNYGQNTGDYGILSATSSKATTNSDGEVVDTNTLGGFVQVTLDKFIVGMGLYQSDNDEMSDGPDGAMSIFANTTLDITDHLHVTPEFGMIDEMEDGSGNKEGSWFYGGCRFFVNY